MSKNEEKRSDDKRSDEKRSGGKKPVAERATGPDAIETDLRGAPGPASHRGHGGGPGAHDGRGGRGHRGGRGRGGPRVRRGEIRNAVISLLAEGPKHGYQLIQE